MAFPLRIPAFLRRPNDDMGADPRSFVTKVKDSLSRRVANIRHGPVTQPEADELDRYRKACVRYGVDSDQAAEIIKKNADTEWFGSAAAEYRKMLSDRDTQDASSQR